MIRREKLVAVISSADIHSGGGFFTIPGLRAESVLEGYDLVVTDSRIVGASRAEGLGVSDPFLWSAGSPQPDGPSFEKMAADIIERKRFDLPKDKIFKILYEAPGLFLGGRVVFDLVGEKIELDVSVLSAWNPGTLLTVRCLEDSLLKFAPEKLYDEKTGTLVRDKGMRL